MSLLLVGVSCQLTIRPVGETALWLPDAPMAFQPPQGHPEGRHTISPALQNKFNHKPKRVRSPIRGSSGALFMPKICDII